jgi:formate-dependent nitrite reductase membrane component NrfD
MLFGFFLASYTGVLLSSSAMPFWSDARLMGALFLASGASTGIAAITLALFLTGHTAGEAWGKLKHADHYSMVIELVLVVALVLLLGAAAKPLTGGHHAMLFWGGLVGVGLVIPFVLDLVGSRVRTLGAVAAALVLIGGFVLRYVVLMSVQA